jgi:hypothetical protein
VSQEHELFRLAASHLRQKRLPSTQSGFGGCLVRIGLLSVRWPSLCPQQRFVVVLAQAQWFGCAELLCFLQALGLFRSLLSCHLCSPLSQIPLWNLQGTCCNAGPPPSLRPQQRFVVVLAQAQWFGCAELLWFLQALCLFCGFLGCHLNSPSTRLPPWALSLV